MRVAQTIGAEAEIGDPLAVGRPVERAARAEGRGVERCFGNGAGLFRCELEDVELADAVLKGDQLSVGREARHRVGDVARGQLRFALGGEVVLHEVRQSVAVGGVDDALAVGTPRDLRFRAAGVRDAQRVAAILRARRPHFAARNERDFLAVGREREVGEAVIDLAMIDRRYRR